ncbi:3-phosphoshikimate 1-carboxyvinyltransferase [Helicobacter monodelphidis]|uniref:3-phosphoshikimate 1-carboxyvinyltransferase n=1 Tax=Helicobacter sp. 15-1451 TaxID=2004995 RepID=UPI000DCD3FCA|nr:3-phosphoshikimate 1-carboxyvinyltransferase [Helicobacter sp. 15-1451]RAX57690.1 3-phosphoshikimate 1-carboxyvinyltransferase [Helicobacter sp. 15-1451]
MSSLKISPKVSIQGEFTRIATDKSISHRCAIFSLLAKERSVVRGYLEAEDTLNTLKIAQSLGLSVEKNADEWYFSPPKKGIVEPSNVLDCGNAGTAMRLYCGLLSAVNGHFVLNGDRYLNMRPMKRVVTPLRDIGARIQGREDGNFAPLSILGMPLKGFSYRSPIASAQVKSAMILAALQGNEECEYYEPEKSRDHSERILRGMGANIQEIEKGIRISPSRSLLPLEIDIPSDPSSAFFFAVAAAITPHSEILLKNVLLNPTRIEGFEVLRRMGANVSYTYRDNPYDMVGDIYVKYAPLHGIEVCDFIPSLIDEIPALAIAMAQAQGESRISNATELRVKECDRIKAVVQNLSACGIQAEEYPDGFRIVGGEFKSAELDSFGDHRIAMSFALVGLICPIVMHSSEAMNVSFPHFAELLSQSAIIQPFHSR